MTLTQVIWCAFLAGLSFSWFAFSWLNPWQAHTLWVDLGVSLLTMRKLSEGWAMPVRNDPLGWWVGYLCLVTLFLFNLGIKEFAGYTIDMSIPILHVASLVLFYLAAMADFNRRFLERLLLWVGRSSMLVCVYCLLQALHFDQFYRNREITTHSFIGVLGNPTVTAIHLSLMLPIFLYFAHTRNRWWLASSAVCLLLIGWLVVVNTAATGAAAAMVALLWWGVLRSRVTLCCAIGLLLVGVWYISAHPGFLNPSGRYEAWREFARVWSRASITGHGLGAVIMLGYERPHPFIAGWQHTHNEFLQVALEQGVIGLWLMCWTIWAWGCRVWQHRRDALIAMLGGMGLAFLMACILSFPMHLWTLGMFGLLSYCGVTKLTSPECDLT